MFNKRKRIITLLLLLAAITILPGAHSNKLLSLPGSHPQFDRSQNMLLNLKSAPLSAGYYHIHSYGVTKQMNHDLEHALNQVVEVDKTYAKSRHKPDERYLESVCLKITVARQTAEALQGQLSDAYSE